VALAGQLGARWLAAELPVPLPLERSS
jgi:hypothetical protein